MPEQQREDTLTCAPEQDRGSIGRDRGGLSDTRTQSEYDRTRSEYDRTLSASETISVLKKDACRFFLQNFANEEMQKNFMMSLEVDDLDAWWSALQEARLPEKYPEVRLKAPQDDPWGKREIHLIGPDGVLWHIATPLRT